MDWIYEQAQAISVSAKEAAKQRQANLTKPPGSLGRLEELVEQLAGLQGKEKPYFKKPAIRVFAADHGVVTEGVSAFPQEVTVQMLQNFSGGGAAVSVLAREANIDFAVINLGTVNPVPSMNNIRQHVITAGTNNFCEEAAMTQEQLEQALDIGKSVADELLATNVDLFIGGEMGIGNTTSAAALACAILEKPAEIIVGRGTGVDEAGLQRKIKVVKDALALHRDSIINAEGCLRCLGGFEIAALTACYIRCAQVGIPILVDGFICTTAALVASRINDSIRPWLIFSHQSAEQGHQVLLEAMQVKPILALDLRLGEGSGAAIAFPILQSACLLHNKMATFDEAGVSNK